MTTIDTLYNRYERNLMHIGIANDAVRLALRLALEECATEIRDNYFDRLNPLDQWLRNSGQAIDGTDVIDTAIQTLKVLDERNAAQAARLQDIIPCFAVEAQAQIIRINDWLSEHAPDEYHQPGDTADAIIAVADRLRGQVAKLRTELAAAIDERHVADDTADAMITETYQLRETMEKLRIDLATITAERDEADAHLTKLAYWLAMHRHDGDGNEVDLAISLLQSQTAELDALRQQLAQLDADNAALIQRNTALAADLATARSYFISRQPTNGHDNTGPLSVSAQSAQSADETPAWNDALLTGLDAATLDYWHGINAGRWTWRKLPKTVRLAMVRHVLSFTETDAPMSMSQFDAFKPHWMPGAGTHPVTFGVTWATLADLRTEIEVPA